MRRDFPHFSADELACKCHYEDCDRHGMDISFMRTIVSMRDSLGFPFIVSSAYRCPKHNVDCSTTGPAGPHTTGKAIDILINGTQARLLLDEAVARGFEGIGVKQAGDRSRRFIHLDMVHRAAGPVVWSYY